MDYKTQHSHRKTETLHIGIPYELYLDLSRIAFGKDLPTSAVGRIAVAAFVSAITGKKYTMNTLGGFRMPSPVTASVVAEASAGYNASPRPNISPVLAAAESASFASAEAAVANLSKNFAGISSDSEPNFSQTDNLVDALLPKILAALRSAGVSVPAAPEQNTPNTPSPDPATPTQSLNLSDITLNPAPTAPLKRRGRPRKIFSDSPSSLPQKKQNSNPAP